MLPSGLTEAVADEELLARFARHDSKYFKTAPFRPKRDLFMPPKGSTVLSVSRVSGMSDNVIRELGEHVVSQAGHTLKGWSNLCVESVRSHKRLDVVSDEPDDEHHFHAHITGFPPIVEGDKSALIQACEDLAEMASDMGLV